MIARHAIWMVVLAAALVAGFVALPYGEELAAKARAENERQATRTAALRAEHKALQDDAAASAKLRAELGAAAWRNLVAPPPRAQIVEALRQIGIEEGLSGFELTLGNAATVAAEHGAAREDAALTSSPLAIKVSAATDRRIFAFAARAMKQLPGYIRLENFSVRRSEHETQSAAFDPVLVTADMDFRWLAFAEEKIMAKARP